MKVAKIEKAARMKAAKIKTARVEKCEGEIDTRQDEDTRRGGLGRVSPQISPSWPSDRGGGTNREVGVTRHR